MAKTQKSQGSDSIAIAIAKIEAEIAVKKALYAQNMAKTIEAANVFNSTFLSDLDKNENAMKSVSDDFEIEKTRLLNEYNSLNTEISEKESQLSELKDTFEQREKEYTAELLLKLELKKAEYSRSLIDLGHKFMTDAKEQGELAFTKFLAERSLTTVPVNQLAELNSYKKSSDSEIAKLIEDAVATEKKHSSIALGAAVANTKSSFETAAIIAASELAHTKDLLQRAEADKEKLEKMVTDLQASTEKIITAARTGGSAVNVANTAAK